MTLFGKQAESFTADDQPVMAFKALKVGDFGGEFWISRDCVM
jgi:replication factor A1